ncbi:hypothetical protein EG329_014282 [Mollisiaceae sp. DMI_Dod_QoI]|nr:hypothetical protein EG329_014282 [Helotiales sp. DMI_Dod_QoI]
MGKNNARPGNHDKKGESSKTGNKTVSSTRYSKSQEDLASAKATVWPNQTSMGGISFSQPRPGATLSGFHESGSEVLVYYASPNAPRNHNNEYPKDDVIHAIEMIYRQRDEAEARVREIEARRQEAEQVAKEKEAEAESLKKRLEKVEKDLRELQQSRLQTLDRFQPVTDTAILDDLSRLKNKTKVLVRFLNKHSSKPENNDLAQRLVSHIWEGPFHLVITDDVDNAMIAKMLTSMIARFLQDHLFGRPFKWCRGKAGELANDAYRLLYPDPYACADSFKWRTLTAQRLMDVEPSQAIPDRRPELFGTFQNMLQMLGYDITGEELHRSIDAIIDTKQQALEKREELFDNFQRMLHALGYNISNVELDQKVSLMFENVIKLARTLASQRAIYDFSDPPRTDENWYKEVDDELYETPEEHEDGAKQGRIAFIMYPGLTRWGTAMGESLADAQILAKSTVHLYED